MGLERERSVWICALSPQQQQKRGNAPPIAGSQEKERKKKKEKMMKPEVVMQCDLCVCVHIGTPTLCAVAYMCVCVCAHVTVDSFSSLICLLTICLNPVCAVYVFVCFEHRLWVGLCMHNCPCASFSVLCVFSPVEDVIVLRLCWRVYVHALGVNLQ